MSVIASVILQKVSTTTARHPYSYTNWWEPMPFLGQFLNLNGFNSTALCCDFWHFLLEFFRISKTFYTDNFSWFTEFYFYSSFLLLKTIHCCWWPLATLWVIWMNKHLEQKQKEKLRCGAVTEREAQMWVMMTVRTQFQTDTGVICTEGSDIFSLNFYTKKR